MDQAPPVYENELLGYFLRGRSVDPVGVYRLLGAEQADNLRRALALQLKEEADRPGGSLVECGTATLSDGARFNSILYEVGGYSDRRKIVTFSFKGAFAESALPLLGLVIAACTGTLALASVPVALAVVKATWSKLRALREPSDCDAIAVLEAIAAAGVRGRGPLAPWSDVSAASGLGAAEALAALKVLKNREIVEVVEWGGQGEDMEHLQNRWKVRL